MAKKSRSKPKAKAKPSRIETARRSVMRWVLRAVAALFLLAVVLILLWKFLNPPTTLYMMQESRRLDGVEHAWVRMDDIAPVMARSVVAAEDANFCTHWGFDVRAIRQAIEDGGNRGASTLSQQVVKNVYLWHGRNYTRKALEALMTPLLEALWSKRRIVEVYLNVAEFDEGVFGVGAAAEHYFETTPDMLTPTQAARLAAILPAPQERSASSPSDFVRKRAAQIVDGAATIQRDGRAACFES